MTLESSAEFLCVGLKVLTKPLNMIQDLLIPWSRVLLEKLTSLQLRKKFSAFYRTWRLVTAITSAHHLLLSWASSIQSIPPHPTSWRSILLPSFYLHLVLPGGLFPPGFPTNILCMPLPSPICATCPAYLILDFITHIMLAEEHRTIQGFPKVNFLYGISCYENYSLFLLCIRSRQWECIRGLVS
jgi:hypothetical protein